jgi:hypothetical protein
MARAEHGGYPRTGKAAPCGPGADQRPPRRADVRNVVAQAADRLALDGPDLRHRLLVELDEPRRRRAIWWLMSRFDGGPRRRAGSRDGQPSPMT